MADRVTLRYEGTIKNVRVLRRRLETAGLDVMFGAQGILLNDPRWPGQMENGRWFQLIVSGPYCEQECRTITTSWSDEGSVFLL